MSTDDMLDLLDAVSGVTARRMFGGTGFFKNGLMFALEADGRFYIKADDLCRPTFEQAGCEVFSFLHKGGTMTLSYYEPPESAFSSPLKMKPWALLGVEASLRSAKSKSKSISKKTKVKPASKKKSAAKKARKK